MVTSAAPHESAPADDWKPDWEGIAGQIIKTLDLREGERVVYLADPYLFPEFFDAVRAAVLRAGGIEQASILGWSRRIAEELRTPAGKAGSAEAAQREQQAHLDLMNTADVFIWLPTDFRFLGSYTGWESEWILGKWKGRGIHFHWFPEPGTELDDPINRQLEQIYQRGILDLDYGQLAQRQQRLVDLVRGQTVEVSTREGTAISFRLPADGWYHLNDGDQSPERAKRAVCARDREQELPCGAVRGVPAPDSVNGVISLRGPVAYNGFGLPIDELWDELDLSFDDGKITGVHGGVNQAKLDAAWNGLTGDCDRLGEVVFGTNPLLSTPPGARMPTYWGFGEGMFRLHLGDNVESSGAFQSNLWINLFLQNATIRVNGETIVDSGRYLVD